MSSTPPDDAQPWVKKILETIADSSPIRDGLHDDEALPLIDWGARCADHLGQRLAAPGTLPEQVDNTAYTLTRLMARVNWLVTYRFKKDAAWLTRTFQMINQLSRELYGDDAPVVPDGEIAAWIADHAHHTNAELVQTLIARLTPAGIIAPSEPVPPASAVADQGRMLPGRSASSAPPAPEESTLSQESSPHGDTYDQKQ